jgi:hypothetical protein
MTAEIVNLRRARKRKGRAAARDKADANAARHGEAKPVRALRQARDDLEARRLDGHQLEKHGREDADEPDEPLN